MYNFIIVETEKSFLKKFKKRLALSEKVCYNQEVIYGIVLCVPLSDLGA